MKKKNRESICIFSLKRIFSFLCNTSNQGQEHVEMNQTYAEPVFYVRQVIYHWNCVALLLYCIDLTVLHSIEIIIEVSCYLFPPVFYFLFFINFQASLISHYFRL